MRNTRKDIQTSNRKLAAEILEAGYDLKFRLQMPSDPKELEKLKNSLVYIPDAQNNSCNIYYISATDSGYQGILLDLSNDKKFAIVAQIQKFQNDNLQRRLTPEFTDENFKSLIFLEAAPDDYKQYKNSLLFLTDSTLDDSQRLLQIDGNGVAAYDKRSNYFIKAIQNELNNKSALNLLSYQIAEILKTIDYQKPVGMSLEEWDKSALSHKKAENPSSWLVFCCYSSVFVSALIDASYFYFGVLFLSMFNPAAFIAVFVLSSIMLAICLISRLYEEYNYQKVFAISQISVELNLAKTECNLICKALESNNKSIDLLNRLRSSLNRYNEQLKKLEANINIDTQEAFLKGLRNGLAAQGVISSVMILGITILLLTGTACPPAFIIGMLAISFAIMLRSIYRYMQSYNEYKKNEQKSNEIIIPEIDTDKLEQTYTDLKAVKKQLEDKIITKPPNLFEEENAEIARLTISGFYKAEKNFGECTLGEPRHEEEWWLTLTSLVFSGSMALVFGFRGTHKMYQAPDDNPNTIPNKTIVNEKPKFWSFFNTSTNASSQINGATYLRV